MYNSVLNDLINREKAGIDYVCSGQDRVTLNELMSIINSQLGTNIEYLAELDAFHVRGAGRIIADHIEKFESESVRAYLIPQLFMDKVKDSDRLVLSLYQRFRKSGEYIAKAGMPAPAHIYTRYDNAFRKMKSKRIVADLLDVVSFPRDAFYLPQTVKMLASWKVPALKKSLLRFAVRGNVSVNDIDLFDDGFVYYPSYSYICRELRFTAIDGLQQYPSDEVLDILEDCALDADVDIQKAARKVLKKIAGTSTT